MKAYIAARIPIGTKGSGALLVGLTGDNSILPFLADKVVYRLKLSPDPNGLLWALLGDDNQILLIDPDNLKVIDKIDNVSFPVDIVFSPDGKQAFVALFNNTIQVYDTATKRLNNTITGLPANSTFIEKVGEMAISPDGNILAIGSKNIVTLIKLSSSNIMYPVTIPALPLFIDKTLLKLIFHPNGNILYVAENNGQNLYSYNITSNTLTKIFTAAPTSPTVGTIQDFKVTSDGRLLYVSGFRGRAIVDTENNSTISTIIPSVRSFFCKLLILKDQSHPDNGK